MSEALLKVPDAALEQARMMLDRARWGATRFQKLDRSATQRIVARWPPLAMPRPAYAERARRETGMGFIDHHRVKRSLQRVSWNYIPTLIHEPPEVTAAKKI